MIKLIRKFLAGVRDDFTYAKRMETYGYVGPWDDYGPEPFDPNYERQC